MAIDAVNASTEFAVPDANRPPQSFSFLLGKLFRVLHECNEYALSNAAASAGEFIFNFQFLILPCRVRLSRRSRSLKAFKRIKPSASP